MDCDWTEKVSLLVDGELDGSQARAVEAHLDACEACRSARGDFLLFRQQLNSYPLVADAASRRRILEAILSSRPPAASTRPRSVWRERLAGALSLPRFAPAAAALALLFVAALAVLLYVNSDNKDAQTAKQDTVTRPTDAANTTPRSASPTPPQHAVDKNTGADEGGTGGGVNELAARGPRKSDTHKRRVKPRAERSGATQTIATRTPPKSEAPREDGARNVVAETAATDAARARRAEPLDAARHAEQAQLLLRSFRNARLADDDLKYERGRSKELLYRNIVLRREAASKGDAVVASVLNRLEPVLIDIANLPDKPARAEVDTIRERVQKNNLLVTLQAGVASRQRAF